MENNSSTVPSAKLKPIVGLILIASGLAVLFEVLRRIRFLFDNPDSFKPFLVLLPQDAASRTVTIGGEMIVMPDALFAYISFGMGLSLLLIAMLIGGIILKRGISLL